MSRVQSRPEIESTHRRFHSLLQLPQTDFQHFQHGVPKTLDVDFTIINDDVYQLCNAD